MRTARSGTAGLRTALRAMIVSIAALTLVMACDHVIRPVDLAEGDACSFCKMAISEKRYACEFLTADGEAYKFDDIGCMRDYIQKHSIKAAATFVIDFNSKQWIEGKTAFYVRSQKFQTPMGGQMAAFSNQKSASDAARKYQGELITIW